MTAEPDLLPCPFCGGQVFMHHGHRDIGFVTCGQRDDGSDGCGVVASFRPNKGGRDAIAAWNRRATAARDAEIEALRAENKTLEDHLVHATGEIDQLDKHAEQLAGAVRGWWKAHRPVGWTEDQHRSCPHVNLATDAEKALATALLREQEDGQ